MNFSTRQLYYNLPPAWRFAARRLWFLPLDVWENLTGKQDKLTPPRGMIFTGGGDFRQSGEKLVGYLREFGGLQPQHHVLDVGSGIGRAAIPLTRFLNEKGSYEGFDVVERGVVWCREKISSQFPNFQFRYVPLDNDLYRAGGGKAAAFRFPYEAGRFDFAIVNSVFTHLLPEEVDNYLGEIHRVLKPGGVCYATFFLFDKNAPASFRKEFDFPFDYGNYRFMDERVKSANVAFDENFLRRDLLEKHGFGLLHLFYGSWRGLPKEASKDFQYLVIVDC